MSNIFTCECKRKTTDPYIIRGVKMCVVCAEDVAPNVVEKRTQYNYKRYQEQHGDVERSRYGRRY